MSQSGSGRCWKLCLASSLAIGGAIASSRDCALAQITPDTTLGAESSVVTPLKPQLDQIDGGAIRDANLFHSFQKFSVGEGRVVYFSNPAGIENIVSRVTGGSRSEILGKLSVLGNANLFLINPNGIIFGPNASLDVKGSFVATTANAIGFGNQGFFSASAPNAPGLLTVNPSALLFNQIAAGPIANSSRAQAGLDPSDPSGVRRLFGLQVADGRSLLLAGGNVRLDGGGLNALGGRVELGGVAGAGTVGLDVNVNNLRLSYPARVQLADVSLTNGARVDASGVGGGNIKVQGRRVMLTGGSGILTTTLGSKPGGKLAVTASDSVELIGGPANRTFLTTQTRGAGAAGEITIATGRLLIRDGAQVSTSTSGKGSGGQLTVTASESVKLIGTLNNIFSGLVSATSATGDAGDIKLNTRRLLIQDGAQVTTESAGRRVSGQTTLATGGGGDLTVNASDSVELIGTDTNGSPNGLFASTQGAGNAGNLKIATGRLIVRDGATVTVSSKGTGDAGDLQLTARSIRLDEQGKLTATSTSGKGGGNIRLQDLDLLLLRRNSEISTKAGGNGNGGNITIDTDLLAALENSNISANAVGGQGGNVRITTQGLFLSPNSKITASSERGPQFNGVVEINTPDVDLSSGLFALPAEPVDVTGLIAQGCPAGGQGESQFIVTGRGGLPPSPSDLLSSDTVWSDLGYRTPLAENRPSSEEATQPTSSYPAPIVEATGWMINDKGEVVLTASARTIAPHIPWLTPADCHEPKTSS